MEEPGAELFYKILSIVGFEGDRTAFFEEFVKLCDKRALIRAMSEMPKEMRKRLVDALESDSQDIDFLIGETIGKEKYALMIFEATSEELQRYIKKMEPLLSDSQKQELASLSESLLSELSAVK